MLYIGFVLNCLKPTWNASSSSIYSNKIESFYENVSLVVICYIQLSEVLCKAFYSQLILPFFSKHNFHLTLYPLFPLFSFLLFNSNFPILPPPHLLCVYFFPHFLRTISHQLFLFGCAPPLLPLSPLHRGGINIMFWALVKCLHLKTHIQSANVFCPPNVP